MIRFLLRILPVALIVAALVWVATAAVPVADFTGTPLNGSKPLVVQFNDTTTNSPTAWAWDFGDGSTSTVQNASHTYLVLGLHTVSLTASNGDGSDAETKTNYVNVTPAFQRQIAATTIQTPVDNTSAYLEAIGGNSSYVPGRLGFDPFMLLSAVIATVIAAVGEVGLVAIFALPFFMMAIVHRGRMTVPAVVGIILGLYIIVRIPGQYQLFAVSAIGISIAAIIYSLLKER